MEPSSRSLIVVVVLALALSAGIQWWSGHVERRVGVQVAALVRPGDIRMLTSENCSACGHARAWFTEHRIPFDECTIERDAACRAEFETSQSQGTPLILVRGKAQVGFSAQLLLQALGAT